MRAGSRRGKQTRRGSMVSRHDARTSYGRRERDIASGQVPRGRYVRRNARILSDDGPNVELPRDLWDVDCGDFHGNSSRGRATPSGKRRCHPSSRMRPRGRLPGLVPIGLHRRGGVRRPGRDLAPRQPFPLPPWGTFRKFHRPAQVPRRRRRCSEGWDFSLGRSKSPIRPNQPHVTGRDQAATKTAASFGQHRPAWDVRFLRGEPRAVRRAGGGRSCPDQADMLLRSPDEAGYMIDRARQLPFGPD